MESSYCEGFSVKAQQFPSKDKNTEVTFLAQLQIKSCHSEIWGHLEHEGPLLSGSVFCLMDLIVEE